MDNKELEDILQSRFEKLRTPVTAPSMVPEVMERIAAMPEYRPARRRFEWLLVLGWMLGAAVCFSGFQGLEIGVLLEAVDVSAALSSAGLGQYQQAATQIAVTLAVCAVLAPILWLVVEE